MGTFFIYKNVSMYLPVKLQVAELLAVIFSILHAFVRIGHGCDIFLN